MYSHDYKVFISLKISDNSLANAAEQGKVLSPELFNSEPGNLFF